MQKWILTKDRVIKNILGLFILSQFLIVQPSWAKLITDEFVKNLSCENLNSDQIFSHLQSDVYSAKKILPVVNWSFRFGAYDLANCWSLSRAQRILFYLGRKSNLLLNNGNNQKYSADEDVDSNSIENHSVHFKISQSATERLQRTVRTLNMFRGIEVLQKFPDYSLIHLQGPISIESEFFRDLQAGFIETRGIIREHRNLRSEIEKYQSFRFHQFIKNVKYIESIDANDSVRNQKILNYLIQQLSKNRLVMINIKNQLMVQHVVLAYSYAIFRDEVRIDVYDSNSPFRKQKIVWSLFNKKFTAPDILNQIAGAKLPNDPTVLFIVDEDERLEIEKYLFHYYQRLCQN